jgi:hypothetical protein
MTIPLTNSQMQTVTAAAALLPVSDRDRFMSSVACRLAAMTNGTAFLGCIHDHDLDEAIEFVLSCRGISSPKFGKQHRRRRIRSIKPNLEA